MDETNSRRGFLKMGGAALAGGLASFIALSARSVRNPAGAGTPFGSTAAVPSSFGSDPELDSLRALERAEREAKKQSGG